MSATPGIVVRTCQLFYDPVADAPPGDGRPPANRCTGSVSHYAVSAPGALPNAAVLAVCHSHANQLRPRGWTITTIPPKALTA